MKLAFTYGAAMAIAGGILLLLLFFAGFHDSVERLRSAQWIAIACGTAISVACLALAMREKRSHYPVDEDWSYGSALGIGVLTGMFASLFGLVTGYVYFGIINPGFGDVALQAQLIAMEEKGLPAAQIEQFEPMIRPWMSPVAMTLTQGFMGMIFSVLLSLVLAIFFRQRPTTASGLDQPPVVG